MHLQSLDNKGTQNKTKRLLFSKTISLYLSSHISYQPLLKMWLMTYLFIFFIKKFSLFTKNYEQISYQQQKLFNSA